MNTLLLQTETTEYVSNYGPTYWSTCFFSVLASALWLLKTNRVQVTTPMRKTSQHTIAPYCNKNAQVVHMVRLFHSITVCLVFLGQTGLLSFVQYMEFNKGFLGQAQHVFFIVQYIGGCILAPILWLICFGLKPAGVFRGFDMRNSKNALRRVSAGAAVCGLVSTLLLRQSLVVAVLLGRVLLGCSSAVFFVAAFEWIEQTVALNRVAEMSASRTAVLCSLGYIMNGVAVDALLFYAQDIYAVSLWSFVLLGLGTLCVLFVWPLFTRLLESDTHIDEHQHVHCSNKPMGKFSFIAACIESIIYASIIFIFSTSAFILQSFTELQGSVQTSYGIANGNLALCWAIGCLLAAHLSASEKGFCVRALAIQVLCTVANIFVFQFYVKTASSGDRALVGLYFLSCIQGIMFELMFALKRRIAAVEHRWLYSQISVIIAFVLVPILVYSSTQPFDRAYPLVSLDAGDIDETVLQNLEGKDIVFNVNVLKSFSVYSYLSVILSILSICYTLIFQTTNL